MKLYELAMAQSFIYFKTDASVEMIQSTINFVQQQENYTTDMFINAVRALGNKISIVKLEPVDIFEF